MEWEDGVGEGRVGGVGGSGMERMEWEWDGVEWEGGSGKEGVGRREWEGGSGKEGVDGGWSGVGRREWDGEGGVGGGSGMERMEWSGNEGVGWRGWSGEEGDWSGFSKLIGWRGWEGGRLIMMCLVCESVFNGRPAFLTLTHPLGVCLLPSTS